jgi:nitroimidazol reductase NimA-like FMN-containing flavoprotein (pyridoxamine 5'-phosphate oxidase superfamily)
MRREDHRMPFEECEALLRRAEVLRVGFSDAEGPYVVPLNFGYEPGRIYMHGARAGRRIEAARVGTAVCFEADEGEIVSAETPCGFTSRFRSVIGFGTLRLLAEESDKRHGLDVLMRQHGSSGEGIPDQKLGITSVAVIEIESMDGKWHPPGGEE